MKPVVIVAVASIVLSLAQIGAADPGSGAVEKQTFRPPGPNIRFVTGDDGTPGLRLTVFLRTDAERAWHLLSDPAAGAKLFGNVKSIRPIPRSDRHYEFRLASFVGEKRMRCVVVVDARKRRVSWRRVDGDLKVFRGSWHIADKTLYDGYVRAEYASFIDPGGIGRLLMTKGRRRNMVVEMLPRLRELVGE